MEEVKVDGPSQEEIKKMAQKEFNEYKAEKKRVRDMNDDNLKDLRQQAEYEKLTYEISHYKTETIKDFIERANMLESYEKAKELFLSKQPKEINLEN